jgi:hypothetical protein
MEAIRMRRSCFGRCLNASPLHLIELFEKAKWRLRNFLNFDFFSSAFGWNQKLRGHSQSVGKSCHFVIEVAELGR